MSGKEDSIRFRAAKRADAPRLSELAFRSKAYWGYSSDFMNACRAELQVTVPTIEAEHCHVTIAMRSNRVVGFYILDDIGNQQMEMDALFVEPDYIASGVGKALMEHAKSRALQLGAESLRIQSDPNALEFYCAAGAVVRGQLESGSIPGRFLPLLSITLAGATRAALK